MEKAVSRGTVIGEGQMLVRKLASTPSNDLTPTLYAEKAKELAKQYGFECRVLDEAAIKREKMGAFLAVTRGSEEPPRFIILTYKGGPENQKPIVLVGKGITFDSGGISLKPGLNMHEMKQDMAGSAVVVGTVVTAARLGINRNIIGLVPTCENMPSGHATRPGDIVRSRKGKTVEIINTDAEGRLILADALDYAGKFDPQAVIDIATLTGAALYILGYAGAPILGNNESLLDRIREASASTAERVWPLPIWDDQREQMKSEIADLVNSGGRPAGTAAAAAFLENFIGEWPWAHIDIASVDLEPKGKPYIPKGASGFGVRLLTELLSNWKKL
jgi:leucyl aminopeptidase